MQQFRLILAIVLLAGSDAFIMNMLKPQLSPMSPYNYNYRPPLISSAAYPSLSSAYNHPRPSPSYSAPPSYIPVKIPVWQAIPSGYLAQPYSASAYDQPSSNYPPPHTYSTPDFNSYPAGLNYNNPGVSYNNPGGGGGYYSSSLSPHNSIVGQQHLDYSGSGRPMVSVPVYFPKDGAPDASPIPITYSNGVSGYYDSSIEGSSVGQTVSLPMPLSWSPTSL